MVQLIKGVTLTALKVIENEKGNIYHALKNSDPCFSEFGEAYFSTVQQNAFKGWKQHQKMRLNIVVPVGAIRFYFVIENSFGNTPETASVELSPSNYLRLTVEPGVWMGFEGIAEGPNVLLNIASIPHNPAESMNKDKEVWMYLFEN